MVSTCSSAGTQPHPAARTASRRTHQRPTTLLSVLLPFLVLFLFLVPLGFFLLRELGNRHRAIIPFDVDEAHALCRATDAADVLRRHPQDLALLRDQHQRIVVADLDDADDLAIPIAGLNVDDADAAARLHAILVEVGALAVSLLGDGQDGAGRAEHLHGDDGILVAQRYAADAVGAAARRPHVAFREPDCHAVARGDEDLAVPVGDLGGDDRIAFLDTHGDDAARLAGC